MSLSVYLVTEVFLWRFSTSYLHPVKNIVPGLEVLTRAAHREFGNSVWYSLVQAGVVEALCKTVTGQFKILDHVTKLQEPTESS